MHSILAWLNQLAAFESLWEKVLAWFNTWQGQAWLVLLVLALCARLPWVQKSKHPVWRTARTIIFVACSFFFWSTLVLLYDITVKALPDAYSSKIGNWPKAVSFLLAPLALILAWIYVMSENAGDDPERRAALLDIVRKERISSRKDLRKLLRKRGFKVGRIALRIDIRELGLRLVTDDNGKYYELPSDPIVKRKTDKTALAGK